MKQPQPKPDYKIYPTLLDAFVWYQKSESDNAEQELLDKINRVPVTDEKALERMNKGTALNTAVDAYVKGERYDDETVEILVNGFPFDVPLLEQLGEYLDGSTPQHYTETFIGVGDKTVLLYGYVDYVRESKCIDLKSTSSYELGKYRDSMQRHFYPVSLSSEGVQVDEFEFLVTDFTSVFKEPYRVDLEESKGILTEQCRLFIEFLESKKHLITDKKVFGLE